MAILVCFYKTTTITTLLLKRKKKALSKEQFWCISINLKFKPQGGHWKMRSPPRYAVSAYFTVYDSPCRGDPVRWQSHSLPICINKIAMVTPYYRMLLLMLITLEARWVAPVSSCPFVGSITRLCSVTITWDQFCNVYLITMFTLSIRTDGLEQTV